MFQFPYLLFLMFYLLIIFGKLFFSSQMTEIIKKKINIYNLLESKHKIRQKNGQKAKIKVLKTLNSAPKKIKTILLQNAHKGVLKKPKKAKMKVKTLNNSLKR